MSTPQTSIYMCAGVPLNNRYDHTLYFATPEAQTVYFGKKIVKTYTQYTYVRRTWNLKVEATMEQARVWSYLFFKNGTGAKTYYYFINRVEYVNDATVELSLELDVIQTYMFDWTLNPCYVEREHSATDAYGENTIDEGLDVGELITAKKQTVDLSSEIVIMLAASMDVNKYFLGHIKPEGEEISADEDKELANESKISGGFYDGIYHGYGVTATPIERVITFNDLIELLTKWGYIESVFTIWEYPARLISTSNGEYENALFPYVNGVKTITQTVNGRPTSIDGYTPKNIKVLQYPYCLLYATNNAGGAAVYHYEKFADQPKFRVDGNIAPNAIAKLTPVDYKGAALNYDESLNMCNFPLCSWNSDMYKLWYAQNINQNNLGIATAGLQIVGGIAAVVGSVAGSVPSGGLTAAGVGGGVSMIASGVTSITQQLAQRADREIQPPQARGNMDGSFNFSRGLQNFDFYHKTVDRYHAEMIDNYFSLYGYACRKVKTPSIHNRHAWTYVKTVASNVTGNFAVDDLQSINNIFDRGITFWASDDVGNYNQSNTPLGG